MKLRVIAIGRLKRGPESDLVARYLERASGVGRSIGFPSIDIHDAPESRGPSPAARQSDEAETLGRLAQKSMANATERARVLIALDETGLQMSSANFAGQLAAWRDDGSSTAIFMIGGADGLDTRLRDQADLVLAFGRMTLPHQIARVVLVEQIYRAMTILAGHPYHRE